MEGEFETFEERVKRQHRERQRKYAKAHKIKGIHIDFKEDEGIDEMIERLRKDGLTTKEFFIRSYKRYEREGGFRG